MLRLITIILIFIFTLNQITFAFPLPATPVAICVDLCLSVVNKDSLNPVAELDGAGNIVSRFVYGSWPFSPDYMIKGGEAFRIVQDHLGSPRVIVNANTGIIAQELSFDEYGNILQDTAQGFQPFGFAGGLYDEHTGLVRFGARDYDSLTGRWTAKDPIGFEGESFNLYMYSNKDPVNYFDPDGKNAQLLLIIAATAGAIILGIKSVKLYNNAVSKYEEFKRKRQIFCEVNNNLDATAETLINSKKELDKSFIEYAAADAEFGANIPGTSVSGGPAPASKVDLAVEVLKDAATK